MTKLEIIRKAKQIIEVLGVKCVAMDANGIWLWYTNTPFAELEDRMWGVWVDGGDYDALPRCLLSCWPGPWQESLITADTPEEE